MEINFEKFMADYNNAVAEKETLVAKKENFIEAKKAEIEQVCGNRFSDEIKATILAKSIEEKAEKFNVDEIDAKIAFFEQYLIANVEAVEDAETPVEENTETVETAEGEFPVQA